MTVLSPQGRLHQVEYAMEAVKQGAAAVGVASRTHVVLCALKRTPGDLATYQKKLVPIDDHIGVALAGLTSDARVLSKYMQAQALGSRMNMDRPIPVQRLVGDIADKAQQNTQGYGGRPFGVGLLVAGYDETGAHLFEFNPSGAYYEFHATAIGARSQAARTYLERHVEAYADCLLDELIMHALRALRETLPPDAPPLTAQNTALGYLGADVREFSIVEEEAALRAWLDKLPPPPQRSEAASASAEAPGAETAPAISPMQTDEAPKDEQ